MKRHDPNNMEEKLRDFPTHKLSETSQQRIHQQVMNAVRKNQHKERSANRVRKYIAGIASVAALCLFIFLGFNLLSNQNSHTSDLADNDTTNEQEDQEQLEPQIEEMNKEKARQVMQQYEQSFAAIVDATNEEGLITSFETTEEVKNHFLEAMSDELASWMVDSYIKEEADGISLIAKDSPTWLAVDQDFLLEQVNEQTYKVIQERNNEVLGHVEMIFQLNWREDRWIVNQIDQSKLEEESTEQPNESNEQNENENAKQNEPEPENESEQESDQPPVRAVAITIVEAVNNRDMDTLSTYVHEEKGLLFSPYVSIDEKNAIIFTKKEITNLLEDNQTYLWGHYDGSGKPIELTPSQFFDEFLSVKPLFKPDDILVNQFEPRGNTINNIAEVFPDATVVEVYNSGTEEYGGMDWMSMNVVLEQNENGLWKLVGIVMDRWTI